MPIVIITAALLQLATGFLQASAGGTPRFRYVLPEGFSGWVCVDFGVRGAPPLKRDGDLYVIEPAGSAILRTSSHPNLATPPFASELLQVIDGSPRRVDFRETQRRSEYDSKDPVSRHCLFFGASAAAAKFQRPPTLTETRLGTNPVLQLFEFTTGDLCEFRDASRLCVAPSGISAGRIRNSIMQSLGKGTTVVSGKCDDVDGIVVQYDADRTVATDSPSRGESFAHAQLRREDKIKGTRALVTWVNMQGASAEAIAEQFGRDLADFLRQAASATCSK